jgi:hypothetical protein
VGKTQHHAATTLDGYLADENNSLDWLFQVDQEAGESSPHDRFFAGVGADATSIRSCPDERASSGSRMRTFCCPSKVRCSRGLYRRAGSLPGHV